MTSLGQEVTGDLKFSSLDEVTKRYVVRVVLVSPTVPYLSL